MLRAILNPYFCCLCSRILSHKIFLFGKSVFCRKKFEKEKRDTSGENISLLSTNTRARKNIAKARSSNDANLKTPREEHARAPFRDPIFLLSPFFVSLKEDREID